MNRYEIKKAYFHPGSKPEGNDFTTLVMRSVVHSTDMIWDHHLNNFVDLEGKRIILPNVFVSKTNQREYEIIEFMKPEQYEDESWIEGTSFVYDTNEVLNRYCGRLNGIFDDYDNTLTDWRGKE